MGHYFAGHVADAPRHFLANSPFPARFQKRSISFLVINNLPSMFMVLTIFFLRQRNPVARDFPILVNHRMNSIPLQSTPHFDVPSIMVFMCFCFHDGNLFGANLAFLVDPAEEHFSNAPAIDEKT
jgi:hypothetical protein